MAGFDVNAARQAGYSDDEIIAHLTQTRNFDVQGAQRAGYSSAEIVDHLASTPAKPNAGLAGPARPKMNVQQSPFGRIDSSDPSQLEFGGMHGGTYDIMPQAAQQGIRLTVERWQQQPQRAQAAPLWVLAALQY